MKVSLALEAFSVFLLSALVAAASALRRRLPTFSLSPSTPFAPITSTAMATTADRLLLWTLWPRRRPLRAGLYAESYHQYFSRQHSHRTVARRTRCHRFRRASKSFHPTVASCSRNRTTTRPPSLAQSFSTARRWLRDSTTALTTTTIFPSIRKPSRAGARRTPRHGCRATCRSLAHQASRGCALRVGAPLRSARSYEPPLLIRKLTKIVYMTARSPMLTRLWAT